MLDLLADVLHQVAVLFTAAAASNYVRDVKSDTNMCMQVA